MRGLVILGRSSGRWLLLLLLAVHPLKGDTFHLYQRRVSAGESGEVMVNIWQVGTNQFYFLPLPGWQVQGDESAVTLTIRSPDQGACIVWRMLNDPPGSTNVVAMTNDFRPVILERYPEGEILSEFTCHVAGGRGRAWDIRRVIPQRAVLQTRFLRVQQPAGLMEFEMTTMVQKFPEHEVTFRALLSSIRIESEPGKE
ncbi:MAG: hypothetical protein H7X97_00335 [Opitutaceae bacterium]|nr:hypothetical protein [Verrucomicrobiales bacterium]